MAKRISDLEEGGKNLTVMIAISLYRDLESATAECKIPKKHIVADALEKWLDDRGFDAYRRPRVLPGGNGPPDLV